MENPEQPLRTPPRWQQLFLAMNRWVLVLLLGVMAVLVITNVIARYVFLFSFTWVEEVSRYLMIWAAFLGLGPALRIGGHIAVESLPNALPPAGARSLRALLVAVMAGCLVAMTWLGWDYAMFGWEQESPVLGWSLGLIYLAIPVGSVLALVHLATVARSWVADGRWEQIEGFDPQAV
jgi:TRAP-type C4-dicarboxylate transport system permease small subunit